MIIWGKNYKFQILSEQHFTVDELRALYRKFKDTLPICRNSFRDIYANIFPHGDVEQFADLIFDSIVCQNAEYVTFTVIYLSFIYVNDRLCYTCTIKYSDF